MGAEIFLVVLVLAGIGWGAIYLFNIRGAADKAASRRNAVRTITAARTMDLSLTQPSVFRPWFFRIVGGIVMAGCLFLASVGLIALLAG